MRECSQSITKSEAKYSGSGILVLQNLISADIGRFKMGHQWEARREKMLLSQFAWSAEQYARDSEADLKKVFLSFSHHQQGKLFTGNNKLLRNQEVSLQKNTFPEGSFN